MPTDLISFVWGVVFMFALGLFVYVIAGFVYAKKCDREAKAMHEIYRKNVSAEDAARRVG